MKNKKENRTNCRMGKTILLAAGLMAGLIPLPCVQVYADVAENQAIVQVQKKIKGQVIDAIGEPLIGVNISVVGQSGGTITDIDGNYSISLPAGSKQLKFSYVGYKDQFINIAGKDVVNIQMQEDNEMLSEVVVVGYGAQKKETLTGAVTVVGEKMLKDRGTVSSPMQALQGQVPGVMITRSSSAPGDESWNMKLRGAVSKNSADALIIIDGVESDAFNTLNPSDIESINFLKDASAAIYGSKAAGGVVLITTKKAKKGKSKIEYNGSVTAKFVGLSPTLMSMDEWSNAVISARTNDGYLSDDTWLQYAALARENRGRYIDLDHSANPIPTFKDVSDYVFFDTDWQDIMWGSTASTSHELAISGGTEKVTYRLSMRYMYDGSNLRWGNNNNQRYNLRLNNTFKVTDKFTIESVIAYNRQDQVSPTQIASALTASTQQPGFPSSTIDGKPYAWGTWGAPNWYCELGGDNKLKVSSVNISETFNYKFNDDFEAVVTAGYNTSTAVRDVKSLSIEWYNYAGTKKVMSNPTQDNTFYNKSFSRTNYYALSGYLNWHKTLFRNHNLAAMIGSQYNLKEYDYTPVNAKSILSSLDIINGIGETTFLNTSKNRAENYQEALLSYFARLNYNYKSKYLLEGNFRYDGSSKFQPENRWAFFYGISAGWRLSEETFLKELSFLNDLKLRLSYGTVGNQSGIDRYDGIQLFNFNQSTGAYVGSNNLSYIATNGKLTSLDRTWEAIRNYNIGLDFGLFDNRLSGTVEVFLKKCNNMLIAATAPGVLGGDAPNMNNGKFKASGWEGNLTWSDKIGEIGYHIGGTFTYATNELVDNGGDASIKAGVVSNREGYPLNSVFGYKYMGKIQTEEQLKKYRDKYGISNTVPTNIRLGDNMYEDVNGDGALTEEDCVYLGTDDPKISYSINAGLSWKGFDLSCVFQGVGMRTIFRDSGNDNWRIPMKAPFQNTTNQSVGNVWSVDTPNAYYPSYTNQNRLNDYNYQCSSWSVENGAYIRLKNVTVGYTFPSELLAKTKLLSAARIYVTGTDLWEKSNINDGWDPEASRKVSGLGRYPFTRNVTFGLNLTF